MQRPKISTITFSEAQNEQILFVFSLKIAQLVEKSALARLPYFASLHCFFPESLLTAEPIRENIASTLTIDCQILGCWKWKRSPATIFDLDTAQELNKDCH